MLKRILFIVITIIILAGSSILGACAPTPAPTKTPGTPSAAPSSEGPVRGGVFRTAALEDPANFDSHTDTSHRIQVHAAVVWNALVKCDPKKSEVTPENMIPDLAEKWDISPDGKTYTFYLRQGVKFHDGHPFTAEDVKYSLDKFRDPKTSAFASNVAAIDSIVIVNDYTVKVNLKYVLPELLACLPAPFAAIQGAHLKNVDPKSTDFLIGTGPFKFVSRVPAKVYIYERNPDYFKKGLPYLDRYEVNIANSTVMVDQFIGGRLDTAGTLRQFGIEDATRIEKLKQMAPEALRLVANNGSTRGLFFNLQRKGPWQDARVRKAMSMALDYDGAIIATVGSLEVGYVAPPGLVPFYIQGAIPQKEVMSILGLDKPMTERVATAKQLMKDAGYPDGFSATCIVRDSGIMYNPPLFAADIWKKQLNIDMKVEVLATALLSPRRDKGEFDMYFGECVPATASSAKEHLGFFTSGALLNSGKWSNTEYDKLFEQIVQEIDPAKRIAAARKAQQIFLDELPYLPFYEPALGSAVRPDMRTGWPAVKGVVLQPGQTTLANVEVIWFANTPDAKRWIETQK